MSTEYDVPLGHTNSIHTRLELSERSSRFDVTAYDALNTIRLASGVDPETLIDTALYMIQVALYAAADPVGAQRRVVISVLDIKV